MANEAPQPADLTRLSAKMKSDWDRRAEENARYYIASNNWESDETFRASGVADVEVLLRGLEGFLRPSMRVLEIGCGIGRLLRVLAARFVELHGVDVSGEMIRQGGEWLNTCPNVRLHETSGVDLALFPDAWFQFVYSYITFQHMPLPAVAACCREIRRVLAPDGRFRFQVLGFERTDGQPWQPPPDDTFTLRSVSDAELASVLDAARLELLARYELRAPEGYAADFRNIRQIWLTCRPASRRRLPWRRRPRIEIEYAPPSREAT